jgi:hypothetical protein
MKTEEDEDAIVSLTSDPWFNPFLGPNTRTTAAHRVIGVPLLAVKTHKRQRALTGKNLDTLYGVMITLLANLIQHYLTGSPGNGIPVPRSHKDLAKKGTLSRYEPFSFPRSFPKMLDALKDLGFAKVTLGEYSGWPGQSKRTTVRAGPKLIALIEEHKVTLDDLSGRYAEEVIILSQRKRGYADKAQRIDYKDNATTERFRKELRGINEWLDRADIAFDAGASEQPVNVRARQLRRQFTMGRFDRGGRLFGGFWVNLPKPVRRKGIRIDGEEVVGLDYSALNPLLAYHVAVADPPEGDAYTLPGLEKYRDGVKRVFNSMLFKNPLNKFPKGVRALFPRTVKCSDVIDAILQRHPMLKGILASPQAGHRLQFIESEIMMKVLRKCREDNFVSLPVFDCVVVKESAEKAVQEIMLAEFKAATGLEIKVKRE